VSKSQTSGQKAHKKKCKHPGCRFDALFLGDSCWKHLEQKDKLAYKDKIEQWISDNRVQEETEHYKPYFSEINLPQTNKETNFYKADLSGANLTEANLKGINLKWVNLQGANLTGTKLQDADLEEVSLQNANLSHADLQGAYLFAANLQGANLSCSILKDAYIAEANLKEANLQYANLREASLRDASLKEADLSWAKLQKADIRWCHLEGADLFEAELQEAFMQGVVLDGVTFLFWWQIQKVGEENRRWWRMAHKTYVPLKNYFHHEGQYDDERKAYHREKLMVLRGISWQCFHGCQPGGKPVRGFWQGSLRQLSRHFFEKIMEFFKWFGLWFFYIFTGFGEKWWLTALWGLGIIVVFGIIYWIGDAVNWLCFDFHARMPPPPFSYFYFSAVTLTTLGLGDISPACSQAQILVAIEAIFGYGVVGGFIATLISRKLTR